jgi:tagatose-6-phosphate ketose/aldose isomerase
MILNIEEKVLIEKFAYNTAKEINQQPAVWDKLYKSLLTQKNDIQKYLKSVLNIDGLKIILTGAGTSAFVGNSSQEYLRENLYPNLYSIDSTDIVANPGAYLKKETPTLIISHARSGDSPESVGVIDIASGLVEEVYFLNIICNKDGYLAKNMLDEKNSLTILMPEETNDLGFAMTSSFTSMLLTDLMLPNLNKIEEMKDIFNKLKTAAESVLNNDSKSLYRIANEFYDRLIYLGNGSLNGLAQESALKTLELTRGRVNTNFNTFLGFRHGPKSAVNDTTLLGLFFTNNNYTMQYEFDLINQMSKESGHRKIIAFLPYDMIVEGCDYTFKIGEGLQSLEKEFLIPIYIIYAQILALYKSLNLGICPDTPNPEGLVNRVVKGVTIYPFVQ